MRTPPTATPRAGVVAAALVLLLAMLGLAGCSAGSPSSEASSGQQAGAADADAGAADADAGAAASAPAEGDAGGGGGDAATAGDGDPASGGDAVLGGIGAPGATGRRVVTSSIDVAVDDVAAAAARVRALAGRLGGEVADERSQGGERPKAEIVLRVPAGDTAVVLDEVADLGQEVARAAESQPVETRLVDLESRTATQRAGVERIRALLTQATSLQDVLALEAELTRRQADLESVDAQRAALADLAALATVTVRLTTPEDVVAVGSQPPPFLQGLDAGWTALGASTTVVLVVLVVLGGVLPFAVVAAVLGGAVLLAARAARTRRAARPQVQPTR